MAQTTYNAAPVFKDKYVGLKKKRKKKRPRRKNNATTQAR